MVNLR